MAAFNVAKVAQTVSTPTPVKASTTWVETIFCELYALYL